MKKIFISFLLIFTTIFTSEQPIQRTKKGHFHLILGAMFTGKSRRLNELLKRFNYAQKTFLAFKPTFDTRNLSDSEDGGEHIESRDGSRTHCFSIKSWQEIKTIVDKHPDIHAIGIDEVMFLPDPVAFAAYIQSLINAGKHVYASGLKLDFLNQPFAMIKELMPYATTIEELKAVCMVCKEDTQCYTQLLVDSKPASRNTTPGIEGAIPGHKYEPRCPNCHIIPQD